MISAGEVVDVGRRVAAAYLLVSALAMASSGPLWAQSAVNNGEFDQDLAAWTLFSGPDLSATWSSIDRDGDSGSGSAELRDMAIGNGGNQIIVTQCVDLSGQSIPVPWEVSAQVELEGEAWLNAWFHMAEYSDDRCADYVGITATELVNQANSAWQTISGDYTPFDSGIGSVRIELVIQKPSDSGTAGLARFDGVSFGTFEDILFSDRFEDQP